jgi:hypothetical protein
MKDTHKRRDGLVRMQGILVVLFAALASIASAIRGEIISCPACRLNSLPELKRFLKEPGNVDSYDKLTVTWIRGRNPDLHIYDDEGALIEKIDLAPYSSTALHQLLLDKGFTKKVKQYLRQ